MKWLRSVQPTGALVAVALFALAASLVFHGYMGRYEFANLNGRQITKRDRLTGQLQICTQTGVDITCRRAFPR